MKIWRIIVMLTLVILSIIAVTSCSKPSDEDLYYEAHKKMISIKSYETTAKIFVYEDNKKREYEFKQIFQYPDKYRLEVISPSSIKGNLTIFNGKTAWVQHIAINQIWKIDDFQQSKEQLMFAGYFFQNFLNSENTKYNKNILNGENSIVITTELPGGNPYFYKQRLWIKEKDFTPLMLDIVDNQEKVIFQVYYENFKINPKLEEALFYLDNGL